MNKAVPADALKASNVPPTVMMGIGDLKYASEAPKELGLQVRRSSDKAGLDELEASIRTHGIIVPLVVKHHKGTAYVTAGNRRLKLARKIYGETNFELPTVDSDKFNGDPREIAMATNLGLPPHPVDRYEVIALLVKEGMTPLDAQAHFGLSTIAFRQVMRMGKMAEVVRNAWRDDVIDAACVKAFALTEDIKEQERVFKLLMKDAYQGKIHQHEVAAKIIGQQRGAGQLVEFVGIAEAEKSGIKVNTDLFGTNHTVSDMKALGKLADKMLLAQCEKLVKEGGWAFAVPESTVAQEFQWGHLTPNSKLAVPTKDEKARLAEIEEQLGDYDAFPEADEDALTQEQEQLAEAIKARGYTPEQRAKGGCFLKIGSAGNQTGKLIIQYGRTKPEDKKRIEGQERKTANGPADSNKKKGPKTDVKSAALAERLSAQLTRATGMAIVREPAIAISALIAGFVSRDSAVGVHIQGDSSKSLDFVKTFEGNLSGSAPNREMLLAQICARALSFYSGNPESQPNKKLPALAILSAINPARMLEALRECFDAADYFKSTDKASVAQAVKESMGADHAAKVLKMKGPEAAKFATANVPQTGWLPPWLRTPHYEAPKLKAGAAPTAKPTRAKAKPAKKAAAKKKAPARKK